MAHRAAGQPPDHPAAPYYRNFGKRLVKTPKLHFLDTGLLCHLLRITEPGDLRTHAMRGAVFETWVVSETLKHRFNQGLPADLYYWRDNHGLEVDLVFEHAGQLHSVEGKSGRRMRATGWMPHAAGGKSRAPCPVKPPTRCWSMAAAAPIHAPITWC